jgi:membrane-associated phospholipid phosphatase
MRHHLAWSILLAGLATLASLWLDPLIYRGLPAVAVDQHDWGRLLRIMGSLVFWVPLAAAFWLDARHRDPDRARRAGLLVLAPAAAGAAAELLKLLIRRERPSLHAGAYYYRPFGDRPLDSHDLGFPSSHVTVAFAGAVVLARLHPRVAPLAYGLAAGCAITRVLTQAHFLSDAVGGALAGWAIAAWIAGRVSPERRPH